MIVGRKYWILIWYGILLLGLMGQWASIYWARRTRWQDEPERARRGRAILARHPGRELDELGWEALGERGTRRQQPLGRELAVLGESDHDQVNIGLVAKVCAGDWGWWRTLTMNLRKVEQMAVSYGQLGDDEKQRVGKQVEQALERIDREPKGFTWRMRAKVGDRKKWYRDVGELGPVMEEL